MLGSVWANDTDVGVVLTYPSFDKAESIDFIWNLGLVTGELIVLVRI